MSNDCTVIVWKRNFGSLLRKCIAARLADHADDEGRGIWPSVPRVAAQCDVSERSVQRTLREFVNEGILKVVEEGGRGPGDPTRYDFDMRVVEALPLASWTSAKGDTVSPFENAKGDTDDTEGCHPVTQTSIEPPEESPLPSPKGEARGIGRDQLKKIEERFWGVFAPWPHFRTASKPKALRKWLSLTDDERDRAADAVPRYLAAVAGAKRFAVSMSSFLSQPDLWLPQEGREKPAMVSAPAFGAGMGMTFYQALLSPCGPLSPPTASERAMIASGAFSEAAIMAEKRKKFGWPKANLLLSAMAHGQGLTMTAEREALAKRLMRGVEVGTALWEEWRSEHERRGWPWLPDPGGQKWVSFPAGGPDGLAAFEQAVREASDDGGGRQAA